MASRVIDTVGPEAWGEALTYLSARQLAVCCAVSSGWKTLLDSQYLWSNVSEGVWADKAYVPLQFRRMAALDNNSRVRTDLKQLSVRQLKKKLHEYQLDGRHCLEKGEFIRLIADYELKTFHRSPTEVLSKRALRESIRDARRRQITRDELTSFEWNFRLRADDSSPLAMLAMHDAWHHGRQPAKCRFFPEQEGQKVEWYFEAGYNPFDGVFDLQDIAWERELQGGIIRFNITGNQGPCGGITRHPTNWGFVLISAATIYTSFAMARDDPFLADEHANDLLFSGGGLDPAVVAILERQMRRTWGR